MPSHSFIIHFVDLLFSWYSSYSFDHV